MPPDRLQQVKQAIEDAGLLVQSADVAMIAENSITLDLEGARKVQRLLEALEDHDDVDAVYSNADMPDDVAAELAKS